ncbi:hypothetical protein FACS1894200_14460 [Spirochaetia bacterium]|nr:hypothetical protein FACS1894200_14460 [Spirochaetia bacterium]
MSTSHYWLWFQNRWGHINDFIAEAAKDGNDNGIESQKLTGFGTLYRDMENPGSEIDRVLELGLKGIKLHSTPFIRQICYFLGRN